MDHAAIAETGFQRRTWLPLNHHHLVAALVQIERRRVANGTGADDHNTHLALPACLPFEGRLDERITGSRDAPPYRQPAAHSHSDPVRGLDRGVRPAAD